MGLGLEAQRQFYKKLYLYAAADLRIGAGSAQQDTQRTIEYFGPFQGSGFYHQTYSYGSVGNNGTGVYAGLGVSLGARIYAGKRMIIGTEFSNPAYLTNTAIEGRAGRTTDLDLSTSRVVERFYLSYRFH